MSPMAWSYCKVICTLHIETEQVPQQDTGTPEIIEQENGKHSCVALNDMAQLAKLCMSIGTKGGLCQKGHNLMDCNGVTL